MDINSQFLLLPDLVISDILSYVSKDELSCSVSIVCKKLFKLIESEAESKFQKLDKDKSKKFINKFHLWSTADIYYSKMSKIGEVISPTEILMLAGDSLLGECKAGKFIGKKVGPEFTDIIEVNSRFFYPNEEEGEYNDTGLLSGQGRRTYYEGGTFGVQEGEFEEGVFKRGILTDVLNRKHFIGEFQAMERGYALVGPGICIDVCGDIDEGTFSEGRMSEGKRMYHHGAMEIGEFEIDLRRGLRIHPNGIVEEGDFEEGKIINGRISYHDVTLLEGCFDF